MVCPVAIVADDLAALESDYTPAHHVYDVPIVRGHHDGHSRRVDAQEDLHDLPGSRWVQVAGRLVGDKEAGPVGQRARDRPPPPLAPPPLLCVGFLPPPPPAPPP